ncbi:MAG: hypothetical protein GYA36_22680 [Veillonellaceae bacterium]|nr:hypothetical protein [Veillonellaceae bacterium]
MNKLPQGIVLNEMARKLARNKISLVDYERFESSLVMRLATCNPEEAARFFKQSDDFSHLEIRAALETIHHKIESKFLETLKGSLSAEEISWSKQLLEIYHQSVSNMFTDVVKTIQRSQTIPTKEP